MTTDPADTRCALWYDRHMATYYIRCDTEQQAASMAYEMEDSGDASIAGVQFPDGRTIARDDWTAYQQYVDRKVAEDAAAREVRRSTPQPEPIRRVKCPFGDGIVSVWDADDAEWVGAPE